MQRAVGVSKGCITRGSHAAQGIRPQPGGCRQLRWRCAPRAWRSYVAPAPKGLCLCRAVYMPRPIVATQRRTQRSCEVVVRRQSLDKGLVRMCLACRRQSDARRALGIRPALKVPSGRWRTVKPHRDIRAVKEAIERARARTSLY